MLRKKSQQRKRYGSEICESLKFISTSSLSSRQKFPTKTNVIHHKPIPTGHQL